MIVHTYSNVLYDMHKIFTTDVLNDSTHAQMYFMTCIKYLPLSIDGLYTGEGSNVVIVETLD